MASAHGLGQGRWTSVERSGKRQRTSCSTFAPPWRLVYTRRCMKNPFDTYLAKLAADFKRGKAAEHTYRSAQDYAVAFIRFIHAHGLIRAICR